MSARTDIARAMREGRDAARDGLPVTACPYDHSSADPAERVHAVLWCRAHNRVAPLPVDYGQGTGTA